MGLETDGQECCATCGASAPLRATEVGDLCAPCRDLLRIHRQDPARTERALRALQGRRPSGGDLLPDVLDGRRYRTVDRDRNKWYLSVSEVDGNPVEVFASTAFDRDHELQSRISNLTTITRLISLILRHVFLGEQLTLESCLKQIRRSSRQPGDLPDMLYGVLSRYAEQEDAGPDTT